MRYRVLFLLMAVIVAGGCASIRTEGRGKVATTSPLVEVARSDRQWTGIAVARDNRIFVNYPRWSDDVPFSVGELLSDGTVVPYPDSAINSWNPGDDPANHFVCVQSVVVDREGYLWILDPANPKFQGVIAGGPKLVKVDPISNTIIQTIRYAEPVIEKTSYLNDVRIDTKRKVAYLTDSGAGAIIRTDLKSGRSRRILANHPSTHSEGTVLTIEGKQWLRPGGVVPQIHADGIALSNDGIYLYYHALTGRTLYRIRPRYFRNPYLRDEDFSKVVETVAKTGAVDGMEFGPDDRVYMTAIEENAIKSIAPGEEPKVVVQSPELAWPDSLAFGPDGSLYVTTSQINRGPNPPEPYKIFKIPREVLKKAL